jgi:hypothetical protein
VCVAHNAQFHPSQPTCEERSGRRDSASDKVFSSIHGATQAVDEVTASLGVEPIGIGHESQSIHSDSLTRTAPERRDNVNILAMTDPFTVELPEVRATLKVTGALRSEVLSELLGVEGTSHPGSALTTIWELSTVPELTLEVAWHLETILSIVRPRFPDFRRLILQQSLDVEMQLSVLMAGGEVPTGFVDAIRVAELASMGASLDLHLRTRE